MKKSFILTSFLILAGLTLNYKTVLSQEEIIEPRGTGEREYRRAEFIGQDVKSTRLNLSKGFEENESAVKDGTFIVEEGSRMLEIEIKGYVNEGQITISISKPDKKIFKEQTIDPSANVEWTQVFTIREDNKEYTGEWTYKIRVTEAKGFYSLSITTH